MPLIDRICLEWWLLLPNASRFDFGIFCHDFFVARANPLKIPRWGNRIEEEGS